MTSFPAIRQDLAFWVPAGRSAAELVEVVRGAGGKLLRDVHVFDVYAREGQTSLAVRLEFRASDRTLTDEEIAPQRAKIVAAVRDKLQGELRG
jgi:phenylalanyl-tRNA synthetase beta chain